MTGEFTLRSGQVSHEYFDKYLFETDPALLARVAARMESLLPDDVDLLGGLEMGGIPIVTALSARTGAIIPLLTSSDDSARLLVERHVCIDTTAAGGNATLMAQAG